MSRAVKIIHIALTATAWGIFTASLVRFIVVWGSLPENLGIHFASDGQFDMISKKSYAAYPYIVTVAALAFFEIAALLSKKIKTGVKISENGDLKIRAALKILLDIFKLGFSFFFSGVWADCVIRQRPLNTIIPAAVMLIMFLSFCAFAIAAIVIKVKNPPGRE
ncbi:MAG: hypothetical protein K2J77_05680 [Oscillospiraceae bacterium]|nr:hypothetical protein [Oscillospiraceae bacterium]